MSFDDDIRDARFERYARPILDETFPTCRDALAAIEAREAWARDVDRSIAHLVAELDPETAHLVITTRDAFRASCKTARDRALVEYADPSDVMRIVMRDGRGNGRSVSAAEFARVLTHLEEESINGR